MKYFSENAKSIYCLKKKLENLAKRIKNLKITWKYFYSPEAGIDNDAAVASDAAVSVRSTRAEHVCVVVARRPHL